MAARLYVLIPLTPSSSLSPSPLLVLLGIPPEKVARNVYASQQRGGEGAAADWAAAEQVINLLRTRRQEAEKAKVVIKEAHYQ